MAQQALGAGGTTVARKRALFGLLDANGWSWWLVMGCWIETNQGWLRLPS